MLQSKPIFAVLLALSFLFSEAHGFLGFFFMRGTAIGYATVSAELGQRMNENNHKLLLEDSKQGAVLGNGFLMLNDLDRLPHKDGDWYCAIRGKKKRAKHISKIYIPKFSPTPDTFSVSPLWGAPERDIMDYIRVMHLVKNPAEALRFSWVPGMERQLQMLIPAAVVENDDSFRLRAKCSKEKNDVRGIWYKGIGYKPVDWQNKKFWDIKGTPGPKPDPSFRHDW